MQLYLKYASNNETSMIRNFPQNFLNLIEQSFLHSTTIVLPIYHSNIIIIANRSSKYIIANISADNWKIIILTYCCVLSNGMCLKYDKFFILMYVHLYIYIQKK